MLRLISLNFPDVAIKTEGAEFPSVLLKTPKRCRRMMGISNYEYVVDFEIDYYLTNFDSAQREEIEDKLEDIFSKDIKVKNRSIKIYGATKLIEKREEKKIEFCFKVKYEDSIQITENADYMQEIKMEV